MSDLQPITRAALNRRQRLVLDSFVRYSVRVPNERKRGTRFKPYQFKTFELVRGWGATVFVRAEVGLVGDEGTMASVLARDNFHFCIGERGGVKVYPHGAQNWRPMPRCSWWEARS